MLGARLAALRRQKGWSQGQLAEKLNISPSAMGMYEQGRREPSVQLLAALAEVFGVSMEYLATGCPAPWERHGLEQLLEGRLQAALTRLDSAPGQRLSMPELTALLTALLLG